MSVRCSPLHRTIKHLHQPPPSFVGGRDNMCVYKYIYVYIRKSDEIKNKIKRRKNFQDKWEFVYLTDSFYWICDQNLMEYKLHSRIFLNKKN